MSMSVPWEQALAWRMARQRLTRRDLAPGGVGGPGQSWSAPARSR
jgi:hypothetical protein